MIQLPDAVFYGNESKPIAKVHKLVLEESSGYQGNGRLIYGSFVGSGSAIKVIRGQIADKGGFFEVTHDSALYRGHFAKPNPEEFEYKAKYHKIGDGLIHAVVRAMSHTEMLILDPGNIAEWQVELFRTVTTPVLPEWIEPLLPSIREYATPTALTTFGCEPEVWTIPDIWMDKVVTEAVQAGTIAIPECTRDMGELKTVMDYVREYATILIESTGSALSPLFDPRTEVPTIPMLLRAPFRPQSWVIEGVKRAIQ